MSFANDRLYNGYLRRNMPAIVSRVKVREIIPHLPCLTDHDKENIEAKRETSGNYDAMVLLLDCLKRRENWPEQFIQALQACEQTTLAAEIRQEYDSLRGVNNSSSASAGPNVVRAHVHPPPAASRPPGSAAAAVGPSPPTEPPPAPREPAAQAPPPVQTPAQQQLPQTPVVQGSAAASSPEPVPRPPASARDEAPPPPSTPPPSPEIQRAQTAEAPLLTQENTPHQEPEENSEPDVRDASGETTMVPGEMSPGKSEAAVPHSDAETSLRQSPSLTPMKSDASDGSAFLTLTPEKHPVQDTTPPVHKVAAEVLQPENSPEPSAAPIVKSTTQPEAAGSPSLPRPNKRHGNVREDGDDNTLCLSKPGQLVSIQPDNRASPPVQFSSSPAQPYSGNSERLEISEAASDAESDRPACAAPSTKAPCQENGTAADHSEPEENHYESPNQSFEVRENVVHVTGVPSLLNLDGQVPVPHLPIVNQEPADGSFPAAAPSSAAVEDTVSGLNGPRSESYTRSESPGGGPSPDQKPPPKSEDDDGFSNTAYFAVAAAVVVGALLIRMALKK